MQYLEVRTAVDADPETVFEFLESFPLYANYSEYLDRVETRGDGSPGTEYDLHLSWWRLSYTATSHVTAIDRPNRIDWTLLGALTARGAWIVEPIATDAVEEVPAAGSTGIETSATSDGEAEASASLVRLLVAYDPDSADASVLDLPRLLSVDAVVDRALPLVHEEARRVVERVVADLEGEPRDVDLEIREGDDVDWPDREDGADRSDDAD